MADDQTARNAAELLRAALKIVSDADKTGEDGIQRNYGPTELEQKLGAFADAASRHLDKLEAAGEGKRLVWQTLKDHPVWEKVGMAGLMFGLAAAAATVYGILEYVAPRNMGFWSTMGWIALGLLLGAIVFFALFLPLAIISDKQIPAADIVLEGKQLRFEFLNPAQTVEFDLNRELRVVCALVTVLDRNTRTRRVRELGRSTKVVLRQGDKQVAFWFGEDQTEQFAELPLQEVQDYTSGEVPGIETEVAATKEILACIKAASASPPLTPA